MGGRASESRSYRGLGDSRAPSGRFADRTPRNRGVTMQVFVMTMYAREPHSALEKLNELVIGFWYCHVCLWRRRGGVGTPHGEAKAFGVSGNRIRCLGCGFHCGSAHDSRSCACGRHGSVGDGRACFSWSRPEIHAAAQVSAAWASAVRDRQPEPELREAGAGGLEPPTARLTVECSAS